MAMRNRKEDSYNVKVITLYEKRVNYFKKEEMELVKQANDSILKPTLQNSIYGVVVTAISFLLVFTKNANMMLFMFFAFLTGRLPSFIIAYRKVAHLALLNDLLERRSTRLIGEMNNFLATLTPSNGAAPANGDAPANDAQSASSTASPLQAGSSPRALGDGSPRPPRPPRGGTFSPGGTSSLDGTSSLGGTSASLAGTSMHSASSMFPDQQPSLVNVADTITFSSAMLSFVIDQAETSGLGMRNFRGHYALLLMLGGGSALLYALAIPIMAVLLLNSFPMSGTVVEMIGEE